jgi:hypothetical protein
MPCIPLMSSAFAFIVPTYIAIRNGHDVFAWALYMLLLTSILNHGYSGQHTLWKTIDKCFAQILTAITMLGTLWYGIETRNIVFIMTGVSGILAGISYIYSRNNRGDSNGIIAHMCVHVCGALGFSLFTIARSISI